jgi:hypothetical protein
MLDSAREQLMGMLDRLNGDNQKAAANTTTEANDSGDTSQTNTGVSVVTTDVLNKRLSEMRALIRRQAEANNDADDNTTYTAGSGMSLSNTTFSTSPGNNGVWSTSGSDWYYSGGKIGVGTNSPTHDLHVDGTANINSANNSILIGGSDFADTRNNALVIGGSTASGNTDIGSSLLMGINSQTEGGGNDYFQTVVGYSASINVSKPRNVVVGAYASASSSKGVAIGYNAETLLDSSNGQNIAVGGDASTKGYQSIVLGTHSDLTADHSAIFGSNTDGLNSDDTFVYGYDADASDGGPTFHGFGTTSPDYRLHVATSSDGAVAGFTDSNGTCTIDPTSTSLSCSSDRRLKDDISKLATSSVLNNISKLSAVTYRWDGQDDGFKQYGFVAQDVEDVYPEFVSEGPDGYKKLSYSSFIPVALEGIKQLDIRLDEIEGATTTVKQLTQNESFVQKVATTMADLFAKGKKQFQTLVASERVKTPELCVGSTCLTETQLKKVLAKTNTASNSFRTYEDVNSTQTREETVQTDQETDDSASSSTPQTATSTTSGPDTDSASSTSATSTESSAVEADDTSSSTTATSTSATSTSASEAATSTASQTDGAEDGSAATTTNTTATSSGTGA